MAIVGSAITVLVVAAGVLLTYRSRRRQYEATGQGPGRSAQVFFLAIVAALGVGLLLFNFILR